VLGLADYFLPGTGSERQLAAPGERSPDQLAPRENPTAGNVMAVYRTNLTSLNVNAR